MTKNNQENFDHKNGNFTITKLDTDRYKIDIYFFDTNDQAGKGITLRDIGDYYTAISNAKNVLEVL